MQIIPLNRKNEIKHAALYILIQAFMAGCFMVYAVHNPYEPHEESFDISHAMFIFVVVFLVSFLANAEKYIQNCRTERKFSYPEFPDNCHRWQKL